MITLKFRLKKYRRFSGSVREWNALLRGAFEDAGKEWIANPEYMLSHFEPGAEQRFQMSARSYKTRRRKKKLAEHRGERVRPLVFWGDWIRSIEKRPLSQWSIKATATSKRQRVVIKVPIPHPMHPTHKGEIKRFTNEQLNNLKKFIVKRVRERIEETIAKQETTEISA